MTTTSLSNWNAFRLFPGILVETVGFSVMRESTSRNYASDFNFFTSFVKGFHAHSGPSLLYIIHIFAYMFSFTQLIWHKKKNAKRTEKTVQNVYAFLGFFPCSSNRHTRSLAKPCIKCLSDLIHGILGSIALNHNLFKGIKSDVTSEEITKSDDTKKNVMQKKKA